ncbi:MAG: hypothetical protein QNK05_03630 [Myxococcota bacterium]|nr:hypothetical protein [Myxococcota bacterium]
MENSPVYEIRCTHCDTSFAPGTKNCVHCGRRIGGRLAEMLGAGGQQEHLPGAIGPGERPPGPVDEVEESDLPGAAGRSPVWVLTALFLVASAVLRTCAEQ